MTVTARCHGCDWTAGPAPWPGEAVDKAAEKHTKVGHPTVTMAAHG